MKWPRVKKILSGLKLRQNSSSRPFLIVFEGKNLKLFLSRFFVKLRFLSTVRCLVKKLKVK